MSRSAPESAPAPSPSTQAPPSVIRYTDDWKPRWDEFVDRSRNGTFLFRRDYMEYHRDRFADHSLVIHDEGRLLALLPASRSERQVVSHGGLTYGGFVIDEAVTCAKMLEIVDAVCAVLGQQGVSELIVKTVPHIYHRQPSAEFDYAAFRRGAVLYRRDVTTAVVPGQRARWQQRRLRSLKKAEAAGVTCRISDDLTAYWRLLAANLATVHQLRPVHTVDEMHLLQQRFPENIRLYSAWLGGEMVAGVIVYETAQVAHAQYSASSDAGRACGALDLLFHHLLNEVFAAKPFFNFGVSTEDEGRWLNEGLVGFKEGFGGRTITHDFYRFTLA